MGGQGWLQELWIAFQHPCHLDKTEAERAQGHDFGSLGHLGWTIGPPTCLGADRGKQAALFIEAQGFG
jgi:hypothetical protein